MLPRGDWEVLVAGWADQTYRGYLGQHMLDMGVQPHHTKPLDDISIFSTSPASLDHSRPLLSESSMNRKPSVVELYSHALDSVPRFSHVPAPRFAQRWARSRAHYARFAQAVHIRET